MKSKIKEMIARWKEEYSSIRDDIFTNSNENDSRYYSILVAEELRLGECINDATELLIDDNEKH